MTDVKMMSIPLRTGLARMLVLAVMSALAFFVTGSDGVSAQEIQPRRSILEVILGKPVAKPRQTRNRALRPQRPPQSSSTAGASRKSPPAVVITKKDDAKKVVIIGDFNAASLADGLSSEFSDDPSLQIVKETDGASGLVRDDHLDWAQTLKAKIAKHRPALVVVMLGSNDRQQIEINGGKEKFRTDGWNKEYERRVDQLIAVAQVAKIPLIWAGLPSFQSPGLSADAATLNNIYRTRMEAAGATFIDIWDGFADENGKFIATGSDINGQPVRLRGSDGLSLTKAGKQKMAFYLEKDIRRLTGGEVEAEPALVRLDSTTPEPAAKDEVHQIVSVAPISLADPDLDGGSQLLDSNLLPKGVGKSPRDLLIEKGETVVAPAGRVDDFSWPKKAKPAG